MGTGPQRIYDVEKPVFRHKKTILHVVKETHINIHLDSGIVQNASVFAHWKSLSDSFSLLKMQQ